MTRSTIEHDEKMVLGVGFRDLFEERLQAPTVHPWKIKTGAFSRCGFDCRVEVGPLVGAPHDVGRTEPLRAVAPPVPVDQPEACLVEGQNLQRLVVASALPLDLTGKLFLNACCSFWSAS